MSKQVEVATTCLECRNSFSVQIYRSIWGDFAVNRDLVFNNELNLITCPSCGNHCRAASPLLYVDMVKQFAVWYAPEEDASVDAEQAMYASMFGPTSFYATAPRVEKWEDFKRTILRFERGELKAKPISTKTAAEAMHGLADEIKRQGSVISLPDEGFAVFRRLAKLRLSAWARFRFRNVIRRTPMRIRGDAYVLDLSAGWLNRCPCLFLLTTAGIASLPRDGKRQYWCNGTEICKIDETPNTLRLTLTSGESSSTTRLDTVNGSLPLFSFLLYTLHEKAIWRRNSAIACELLHHLEFAMTGLHMAANGVRVDGTALSFFRVLSKHLLFLCREYGIRDPQQPWLTKTELC